jgi:hypothetical protein
MVDIPTIHLSIHSFNNMYACKTIARCGISSSYLVNKQKKSVFPTDTSMMMHLLPSLKNLDHQVGLQKQAVAIHALPRLRGIDQDQIVPAKDLYFVNPSHPDQHHANVHL